LLLVCSLAFLFSNLLHSLGGQTAQQPTVSAAATSTTTASISTSSPSPGASPTAGGTSTETPGPGATGTPVPPPTRATLPFPPTTKPLPSEGHMTPAPGAGGCDMPANPHTKNMVFYQPMPATQIPQSSLQGTIRAVNSSTTTTWTATNYSFTGGGWSCAPLSIS